jgi:hypothetical protein
MLLALVMLACSSPPTYLEDLKMPALVWERSRGLCGSGMAVDGDGQLWVDPGGCENGRPVLSSRGRGAPEKVRALRLAFEALRGDAEPDQLCQGQADSFSKIAAADGFSVWTCASDRGSSPDGLQEPFLSVAKMFLALP